MGRKNRYLFQYYITKNSPPVFIVHGNKDTSVPYEQSVRLYKKLTNLGVKCEFMTIIENGDHGKFTKEQKRAYKKRIFEFLEKLDI